MNDIKAILKLILQDKKKVNTYDRYPIRFLFMNLNKDTESQLTNLCCKLNDLSKDKSTFVNEVRFINLYDLLSFNDGWITKSQLLNYIISLDDNHDYIIVGFSELIRFYSKNDLEALLISFMTNIESSTQKKKQRIYFVCFSLFDKIETELKNNSRNESINPVIKIEPNTDEHIDKLCIYYANASFQNEYFNNSISYSKQWLALYKAKNLDLSSGIVCVSDTLVTLYEKARPDNFVEIDKLDSYFKLLTTMFKMNINSCDEQYLDNEFWEFLFKKCYENSCFNLKKITQNILNITKIDDTNFIQLFNSASAQVKKLLLVYLKEYYSEIDHSEYLIEVLTLSKDNGFSTFVKDIVTLFSMDKDIAFFKSRKFFINMLSKYDIQVFKDDYIKSINKSYYSFLLTKIFNAKVEEDNLFKIDVNETCKKYSISTSYYIDSFKEFYHTFLSNILTCQTKEDKSLVILLLQNDLISFADAKLLYSDLFGYLGSSVSNNLSNSLQWVSKYLYEYKQSKIMNIANEAYLNQLYNLSSSFPSWYLNADFVHPFESLSKHSYDKLIVLDGIGAEYFDYLLFLAKKYNKHVLYANVCKCFLPSITEVNKSHYVGKYDSWIQDFDKDIVHGTIYRSNEIIPRALDRIEEIFATIIKQYNGLSIAIIADHGTTASGKIVSSSKKYSFNSEHEGRCLKVESFNVIADSDDYYKFESEYDSSKWIISLNNVSLDSNPKRESHGGATLEEIAVPCVIISDSKINKISYSVKLVSMPLSGLNRKVTFEILPHLDNSPVLEEENGNQHIMQMVDNNIWECDIDEIKTQEISILTNNTIIKSMVYGSMGASTIGGDGFDD